MATSALLDLANPNGDENTPSTTLPVDNVLDPTGSGMGLPSGTPDGGGLGSILGNALAVGLAGFAPTSSGFQNLVQQQVFKNMQYQRQMDLLTGVGKAFGVVNQHLANGDIDQANAAYRDLLRMPGAVGIPGVLTLGKSIQDRAYELKQRQGLARILGLPDVERVTLPGTGTAGTTQTETTGEAEVPSGNAERLIAPSPAAVSSSEMLRDRLAPPTTIQPTGTAPDATLGNQPSITTSTPGTPDQQGLRNLRALKFSALVALGMDPTVADKLLYPEPMKITGPFGSEGIYDRHTDTVKMLTPGSIKATPGETFSLLDWNHLGSDGKPTITPVASGGAKPVTYADLDVKDRGLLPVIGTSQREFDRLATSTDPDDRQRYSDLVTKLDLQRAVRDADPLLTQAAVSVGVNPQSLAIRGLAGLPDSEIKAVHGALQDFKIQEQTNALTTSERLKMQQPVLVAMPQLGGKMLVTKDGKFNLVEPAAFGTGAQFTAGYDPNKYGLIDAKERDQLELLNATTPIIGGVKQLIPEVYQYSKDHPGATLGQFVTFYAKTHTGASPALAALGSLNVGLAAEITRATTGGTRPAVQVFNKVTDVDTPSWKDSIDTALRKIDTAEQTIDVRRRSLAHMPVGEINPTRPIPGATPPPMRKDAFGFNVPTR